MLAKGIIKGAVLLVAVILFLAFVITSSWTQDWKKEHVLLRGEMFAVGVTAKEYSKKGGEFPVAMDSILEAQIDKAACQRLEDSNCKSQLKGSKAWLVCKTATSDEQAVAESRKLDPGQVLYCTFMHGSKVTGYRVLAKDSGGELVMQPNHDPLMLRETDFQ